MTSIKLTDRFPASWETERLRFVEQFTEEETTIMKFILSCDNPALKHSFGLDQKHHNPQINYESNAEHLTKFISLIDKGGNLTVSYSRVRDLDFGRYYASKSLSIASIHRPIRHTILSKHWVDIDISNCHVVALYYILKNSSYTGSTKYLKRYIDKRDETLAAVMDIHSCSRDQAKTLMLRLLYGGSYEYWKSENNIDKTKSVLFVKNYASELSAVMTLAVQQNPVIYQSILDFKRSNGGGENDAKRSLLSHILQDAECKMLDIIFNTLRSANYIPTRFHNGSKHYVCALSYDGITVRTTKQRPDLLRKAEAEIKLLMKIEVKLEYKDFDTQVPITNTPEEMKTLIENSDKGKELVKALDEAYHRHTYSFPDYTLGTLVDYTNEIYSAHLFVKLMGDRIIKCGNSVYMFDTDMGMWSNEENMCCSIIHRIHQKISICEWSEKLKKYHPIYLITSHNGKKSLWKLLNTLPSEILPNDPEFLENGLLAATGKLLFRNCIYDMKTDRILPFSSKYVFLKSISRNFIPRAAQSDIDEVYNTFFVLPYREGSELGNYFLNMIGFALTGDKTIKRVLFNIAPSNSGKGCMTSLLSRAFGDFVQTFDGNNLLMASGGGDEAKRLMFVALLVGSRMAIANEVRIDKTPIDGNLLKSLSSGGDPVKFRELYKGISDCVWRTMLMFLCNSMPNITPNDDGLHNRLRHIDQHNTFVTTPSAPNHRQADHTLKTRIQQDDRLANAFFWLVVERYRENIGRTIDSLDTEEVMLVANNNNGSTDEQTIIAFIEANYEFTGDDKDCVPFRHITENVSDNLVKTREITTCNDKLLSRILLNHFGSKSKSKGTYRVRTGLKIRPQIEDIEEEAA